MYSEDDINSAVSAGAITQEAAGALRDHVAALRQMPRGDEENFRLINSFNDIFVTIACLLVIFAAAAIGSQIAGWLGGALIALVCWPLAEIFTRRRRAALPSIILLIAFVSGLATMAGAIASEFLPKHAEIRPCSWCGDEDSYEVWLRYPWEDAVIMLVAALAGAVGALAHWLRFRVAITIAAGVLTLVLIALSIVAAASNTELASNAIIAPAALICGIIVFAYAMWWDMGDPARTSQRADIAFWLHLVAAPLIAHPLFYWMGVTTGQDITIAAAIGVIAIYIVFAVLALIVDRRALLVSALLYVLIALAQLFRSYGAIEFSLGLTAFCIGLALLSMSVLWPRLRALVLGILPASMGERLPPATHAAVSA